MSIAERIILRVTRRGPDFVIGGVDDPYLRRWWVIPRNRFFNVYLHQFLRSDEDRAHHGHPWLFNISWVLRNAITEYRIGAGGTQTRRIRSTGALVFRRGASPHRLELPREEWNGKPIGPLIPCWTLFITGPRVREWGFYCPTRWVHWKDFTKPDDIGSVGRGCDK